MAVPELEGVLIACTGGGNGAIATKITEAVQALFDVPAHKIVVLELK
jgi:stage III sporulation protein AG